AMAAELIARGHRIISSGTDNHLMVVDMTAKGVSGKEAEKVLDRVGISTSRSTIPFDPRKPMDPSGVRLGTAAMTTRGFDIADAKAVASCIDRAIEKHADSAALDSIRGEILALCKKRPLYNK
ncbi:MAG TPA: serine hydroxymethyltransferase, partial [Fibrobacteraceae bacterium]|nr:serine hydroxymethyltransferase [Fibrobacteraceae bacterium]